MINDGLVFMANVVDGDVMVVELRVTSQHWAETG